MIKKLAGRVALVTGAGSGIGAATALLFSFHGARLAVLSNLKREVAVIAEEIEASGEEVLPLVADVSQPSELLQIWYRCRKRWGQLDVLVANAGVNGVWAPLDELSVEEWDSTLKVNPLRHFSNPQVCATPCSRCEAARSSSLHRSMERVHFTRQALRRRPVPRQRRSRWPKWPRWSFRNIGFA